MDVTTLEKANNLNNQINKYSDVIYLLKKNAQLILEVDDDGREQIKINMPLSNELVAILIKETNKIREAAVTEFNNL